jgi:hypothetical protein
MGVKMNIHRRQRLVWPDGLSWQDFYAAPLGAPTAGMLGFMAERMPPSTSRLTFLGLPAGRMTAAIAATGLLGTAGEAGLALLTLSSLMTLPLAAWLGINPGAADLLARYEPPSGQHRLGTAHGGERTQLGIPALQSNFPPKVLA